MNRETFFAFSHSHSHRFLIIPVIPLVHAIYICVLLYGNVDQTLMNSLHGLMNCEIGGLDWCVITEYIPRVHCIHMLHLFCNALVHVIYSVVSGQYSYTCTI